jgi:hypothetical protein
MFANGRGEQRDDALASAMFQFAASMGHEPSRRALELIRTPPAGVSRCLPGATRSIAGDGGHEPALNLRWEMNLSAKRK